MSNQPPTNRDEDLEGAECYDCHFHEERHTLATNIAVIHVANPDEVEDVMEFEVPVCNTHALDYSILAYDVTCTGEPIPLSCMNPTATAQTEEVVQ